GRGGRGGARRGRGRGGGGRGGCGTLAAHTAGCTVRTREVAATTAARPTNHVGFEVLRCAGVIGVLVRAGHIVIDWLDAERVVVGAERRVHGGRPLPLDGDPRTGGEVTGPRDRVDPAREVDRHLECQAAEDGVPGEAR